MDKESIKQIVSRIDERTSMMQIDIGDMKKDLNRLNERTTKNEIDIASVYNEVKDNNESTTKGFSLIWKIAIILGTALLSVFGFIFKKMGLY